MKNTPKEKEFSEDRLPLQFFGQKINFKWRRIMDGGVLESVRLDVVKTLSLVLPGKVYMQAGNLGKIQLFLRLPGSSAIG
ncbi:hypothetical protein KXD40_000655 [Peronospora effusa]|uniref:Uncharacterized protein n=1 Tax=Peronospora effusa TaxID=542832 RepID=A0A3M6V736_9STRA|nr:hypothetical protein DD238_008494 [Peronospora effusa]UIZ21545.1 hypothetical protein KXD40_000655 [Peronospora effusa]